MKRALAAVVLVLFVFASAGQVFAQASEPQGWNQAEFQKRLAKAREQKFTGTVLSHDPLCHCVVVKTPKGELTLLDDYAEFMQKYDKAKGLKIGARVNGSYKTVNHINYLVKIEYVEAATTASIPLSLTSFGARRLQALLDFGYDEEKIYAVNRTGDE